MAREPYIRWREGLRWRKGLTLDGARALGVVAFLPRMGVVFAQTHSHIFSLFKYIQRYSTLFCGENGTYRARHIHIFPAFYVMR